MRHLGHFLNPDVPWCSRRQPGDVVVSESPDCPQCQEHQARFRRQLTSATVPMARVHRRRGRK